MSEDLRCDATETLTPTTTALHGGWCGGSCENCGRPVRDGEPVTRAEGAWLGQCCMEVEIDE